MFKKIITALVMITCMSTIYAKETITVVWGFNIGSNQANTVRIMCDELNQIQDKYTFIIGHKPGAGGTIAANYVEDNPNTALVSMSSSFIIRPYYETAQVTHNLDNFAPILVQGIGAPMYVVSKKFTSIEQLINTPNVSIGISGIGSISHLAANELAKANKTINIVNFQNMIDAATSAAGGHIDAAITFEIDAKGLLENKSIQIIGATGSPNIDKSMLLTSYKLKDAGMLTANYAIYASKKMDPVKYQEIYDMLVKVNRNPAVLASYKLDQLNTINLSPAQSSEWYAKERTYWSKQVNLINGAK
jgi:tripartite-type tricarboxylate transporter receptor subunit TctC